MAIHMRIISSDDDPRIPPGKAMICMDNNGWCGTNNGWPLGGKPALFPLSQANAIALAWSFLIAKGVRVFPRNVSDREIAEFPGLAILNPGALAPNTLSWLEPSALSVSHDR
jgi:hypothetical protein